MVTLVGSAADCGVRLIDPSVADDHCALIRTPRNLWVVDLLGKADPPFHSGTRINESPVRFARIDPGDALQVGQFRVRLEDRSSIELVDRSESTSSERGARAIDAVTAPGFVFGPVGGEAAPIAGQFETRLSELDNRHRTQFVGIRRRLEELREMNEEILTRLSTARHFSSIRSPTMRKNASPAPAKLNAARGRLLGSALRRDGAASSPGRESLATQRAETSSFVCLNGFGSKAHEELG